MAKLLLGHGADVNGTLQAGGDTGTGPLEESRATDPAYHPTTPLWEAARAGHADVARLLLAEGADANVPRGQDLSVPLHAAAGEGHLGVVRLLVAQGADVGVQDAGGETPLDWAAGAGRNEVVDFLKQQGAAK
jgi:ankyrin repeat protein